MLQKIIDTLHAEYDIDDKQILLMMAAGANDFDARNHLNGWDKIDTHMHDVSDYLYNEVQSMMHNTITSFIAKHCNKESEDDKI